jgi:hypothetical protein
MKPADNELGGKCSILAGGGLFLFATGPHWLCDTPRYLCSSTDAYPMKRTDGVNLAILVHVLSKSRYFRTLLLCARNFLWRSVNYAGIKQQYVSPDEKLNILTVLKRSVDLCMRVNAKVLTQDRQFLAISLACWPGSLPCIICDGKRDSFLGRPSSTLLFHRHLSFH